MRNGESKVRLDTSLESLLEFSRDLGRGVLATLVGTAGSTYRKPGARMLINADGTHIGLLSGGCLESDLGEHASQVRRSGEPRAVEYDMRGPDDLLFGLGAGCEGAMRVLLEPLGPGSPAAAALAEAGRVTRAGRAAALVIVHESPLYRLGTYHQAPSVPTATASPASADPLKAAEQRALTEQRSQEVDLRQGEGRLRALVQFLAPPPHLLICGAGPDAQPVVAGAVALGWTVTVVDHRPAYAVVARFPGASVRRIDARELATAVDLRECHAAVVMSHHLPSDVAYLRVLAAAGIPGYVGLLGPSARRQRIADDLGSAAQAISPRLHGPVGLDIGAATPEGIALAILAEIHGWLADPFH